VPPAPASGQLVSALYIHATALVANVKRKKSIELSKGESLSLYTREYGALWESMEVHDWKYQWRVKTRV